MIEVWMDVLGYGNKYEVSSAGNVRAKSHKRRRMSRWGDFYFSEFKQKTLKQKICSDGRLQVCLFNGGKKFSVSVHRLVLGAFVGPCPKGMEACHNNGDCKDNRAENLRWDTKKNNAIDREIHGKGCKGEKNKQAKLTTEMVLNIISEPTFNSAVAAKYGIEKSTGYRIRRGASWKHVPR